MAKLKEKEEQKNALEKVNMNIRYIDSLRKGRCNPVMNIQLDKKIKSLAFNEKMRTHAIESFIKSLKKEVQSLCKQFSFELEEADIEILNYDIPKKEPSNLKGENTENE